jgi:hypothetical protein
MVLDGLLAEPDVTWLVLAWDKVDATMRSSATGRIVERIGVRHRGCLQIGGHAAGQPDARRVRRLGLAAC